MSEMNSCVWETEMLIQEQICFTLENHLFTVWRQIWRCEEHINMNRNDTMTLLSYTNKHMYITCLLHWKSSVYCLLHVCYVCDSKYLYAICLLHQQYTCVLIFLTYLNLLFDFYTDEMPECRSPSQSLQNVWGMSRTALLSTLSEPGNGNEL